MVRVFSISMMFGNVMWCEFSKVASQTMCGKWKEQHNGALCWCWIKWGVPECRHGFQIYPVPYGSFHLLFIEVWRYSQKFSHRCLKPNWSATLFQAPWRFSNLLKHFPKDSPRRSWFPAMLGAWCLNTCQARPQRVPQRWGSRECRRLRDHLGLVQGWESVCWGIIY